MQGGIFEKNNCEKKIESLESKILEEDFWQNKTEAQKVLKEA